MSLPAAAMRRHDRDAELGEVVLEGEMCGANQRKLVVVDPEYRVAIEVDALDVRGDGVGR